jgi:hypothetical protein
MNTKPNNDVQIYPPSSPPFFEEKNQARHLSSVPWYYCKNGSAGM